MRRIDDDWHGPIFASTGAAEDDIDGAVGSVLTDDDELIIFEEIGKR